MNLNAYIFSDCGRNSLKEPEIQVNSAFRTAGNIGTAVNPLFQQSVLFVEQPEGNTV